MRKKFYFVYTNIPKYIYSQDDFGQQAFWMRDACLALKGIIQSFRI